MKAIEMQNVTKKLGDFQLDLPKLAIEEGYITGFIGENGSGKTTTIKLIMDMIFPDSGDIHVFGRNAHQDSQAIKQDIGYMGDMMGYMGALTLNALKNSIAPFYHRWDQPLYQSYLKSFQLDEKKTYNSLSKGMKKKFDLIMALSHHPKLLLLDEPTAKFF